MFIAALFTIAKTWKQPKCPSTDKWIKKMWHTYPTEYYSTVKKNEIIPYLSLSDFTFSMIISRPIHVAADDIIAFFLWLSNIPVCIYTTTS